MKISFVLLYCIFIQHNCIGQNGSLDSIISIHQRLSGMPAYYRQVCHKLALKPIDSTLDFFTLRLWSTSMIGNSLLSITSNDEGWQLHKYGFIVPERIIETKLKPKVRLNRFIDSLNTIDFFNLRQQPFQNFFSNNIDDGVIYMLEVSNGKQSVTLNYSNPDFFNDEDDRKFARLVRIINQYLY